MNQRSQDHDHVHGFGSASQGPVIDPAPTRRRILGLLGGAGAAVVLAACGGGGDDTSPSTPDPAAGGTTRGTAADATTGSADGSCAATPAETGGPFPADGSNDDGAGSTANVLDDEGIVRRDIRADLDGSDVQAGVPMTLEMRVLDAAAGCVPLPGAAVYIWHCNREGEYSAYNARMLGGDFSDHTWLRGVQVADDDGIVRFETILPGRYQGRAFHIHFEVFADDSYTDRLLTSQLAADDDEIDAFFTEAGYSSALRNDTSNGRDNVFGDGVEQQIMTFSGDVGSGLAAVIDVAV